MSIPDWWQTLLLLGAAFRVYRLLSEDTILDGPREKLLRYDHDGMPHEDFRASWSEWLTCPWCCGAWCSGTWWLAWQFWPHFTTAIAVPLAVSAALGLVAKLDQ